MKKQLWTVRVDGVLAAELERVMEMTGAGRSAVVRTLLELQLGLPVRFRAVGLVLGEKLCNKIK